MKQYQIILLGLAAFFVVLGGIVWLAQPQPAETGEPTGELRPAVALKTEESSFDFGAISMAAGKVKREFVIRNTGSDPAVINKIYTSCMCTTATLKIDNRTKGPFGMAGHGFIPKINEKLAPDQEAIVEVIFDPAAHGPAGVGPVVRAVYVETDNKEVLELRISATVTP